MNSTLKEKVIQYLTKKLGHIPTEDEIAEFLNVSGLLMVMEDV